jgi:hypothetical protein
MVWMRKPGASRSALYSNVRDAAIVWFSSGPPPHVDATLVRQGVISQISTPDEPSIARLTALTERAPWVRVVSDPKWKKFVSLDAVTDVVLEDDPPPGATHPARKLVLSITYFAPGNPNQPQNYACGEIHDPHVIDGVLHRLGLGGAPPSKKKGKESSTAEEVLVEGESGEVEAVILVDEETSRPRRAKRKARGA